jgi:hypothetical protein
MAQHQLEEWLRERPVTTIPAPKTERFTLRVIAVAEREGVLTVDFEAGRVSMLPLGAVTRREFLRRGLDF